MSEEKIDPTSVVMADVFLERMQQDEKWGVQELPFGTGPLSTPLQPVSNIRASEAEEIFRARTDRATDNGSLTFADVLLEEVFEAMAEADPSRLRAELIQTAAVCVKIVEAIDRRHGGSVSETAEPEDTE